MVAAVSASSTATAPSWQSDAYQWPGHGGQPSVGNSNAVPWDEQVVPALRKQLEAESAALGRRISRLDSGHGGGWANSPPLTPRRSARDLSPGGQGGGGGDGYFGDRSSGGQNGYEQGITRSSSMALSARPGNVRGTATASSMKPDSSRQQGNSSMKTSESAAHSIDERARNTAKARERARLLKEQGRGKQDGLEDQVIEMSSMQSRPQERPPPCAGTSSFQRQRQRTQSNPQQYHGTNGARDTSRRRLEYQQIAKRRAEEANGAGEQEGRLYVEASQNTRMKDNGFAQSANGAGLSPRWPSAPPQQPGELNSAGISPVEASNDLGVSQRGPTSNIAAMQSRSLRAATEPPSIGGPHGDSPWDWEETLPPAVARRLAQEELLRKGVPEHLQDVDGLIDTWDTQGLPLTERQARADAHAKRRGSEPYHSVAGLNQAQMQSEEVGDDAKRGRMNDLFDGLGLGQQEAQELSRDQDAERLRQQQQQQQQNQQPQQQRRSQQQQFVQPSQPSFEQQSERPRPERQGQSSMHDNGAVQTTNVQRPSADRDKAQETKAGCCSSCTIM
ncbi:unnamed protein product [Jaminaea pallidilutea]